MKWATADSHLNVLSLCELSPVFTGLQRFFLASLGLAPQALRCRLLRRLKN